MRQLTSLDAQFLVLENSRQTGHVGSLAIVDPPPSTLQMLGLGVLGLPKYPVRMLRSLPRAVPNLGDTPFGVLPGAGTLSRIAGVARRDAPPRPSLDAPKTI